MAIGFRPTPRDFMIKDFIEKHGVCSTEVLCHFFFDDKPRYCQQRLTMLTKGKFINRERVWEDGKYLYYIKMPKKQAFHMAKIADCHMELDKMLNICRWSVQAKIGKDKNYIIPDLVIEYDDNGKRRILFLEVEISNHHPLFDEKKYMDAEKSGLFKKANIRNYDIYYYRPDKGLNKYKSM